MRYGLLAAVSFGLALVAPIAQGGEVTFTGTTYTEGSVSGGYEYQFTAESGTIKLDSGWVIDLVGFESVFTFYGGDGESTVSIDSVHLYNPSEPRWEAWFSGHMIEESFIDDVNNPDNFVLVERSLTTDLDVLDRARNTMTMATVDITSVEPGDFVIEVKPSRSRPVRVTLSSYYVPWDEFPSDYVWNNTYLDGMVNPVSIR